MKSPDINPSRASVSNTTLPVERIRSKRDNDSPKSPIVTSTIAASSDGSHSSDVAALVQETPKKSWKSYLWDTLDKPPEERRFLFKLDAVILTAASLGYFIKNLDQYNMYVP